MQRNSELCAMAGLARYYARDCENLDLICKEALSLIGHRWGLTDAERSWCIEVLTDEYDGNRRPRDLIQHTSGILSTEDYTLLAQCLGWFGSSDSAMTSLVTDLSSLGLRVSPALDLFPDLICEAFRILELEPTLDFSDLDAKYREWAKLLHPDSLIGVDLSTEERHDAEHLLGRLSRARDEIKAHLRSFRRAGAAAT